jgi:hypothetical protein
LPGAVSQAHIRAAILPHHVSAAVVRIVLATIAMVANKAARLPDVNPLPMVRLCVGGHGFATSTSARRPLATRHLASLLFPLVYGASPNPAAVRAVGRAG